MPSTDDASLDCSTVLPDHILQGLSSSQIANIDKCVNDCMLTIESVYNLKVYAPALKENQQQLDKTQFKDSIAALADYLHRAYRRDNRKSRLPQVLLKTTDSTRYTHVKELLILIKAFDAVWLDQASNESSNTLLKSTLTEITLKCDEILKTLQHQTTSKFKTCVEIISDEVGSDEVGSDEVDDSVRGRLETLQLPVAELEYLDALGKKVQSIMHEEQSQKELLLQLEGVGIVNSVSRPFDIDRESLIKKQYQQVERAIQAVKQVKVTEKTARGNAWANLVVALSVADLKPFFSNFSEEKKQAEELFSGIVRNGQPTDYSQLERANNNKYDNAKVYFERLTRKDAKSFSSETRQDLINQLALPASSQRRDGDAGQQYLDRLRYLKNETRRAIQRQEQDGAIKRAGIDDLKISKRAADFLYEGVLQEKMRQLEQSVEAVPDEKSVIIQKKYHEGLAARLATAKVKAEPFNEALKAAKHDLDSALTKAQANDRVLNLIAAKRSKIQLARDGMNVQLETYRRKFSEYNINTDKEFLLSEGVSLLREFNFHSEESELDSDLMVASQNLKKQYKEVTDEFAGLSQEWDSKIKILRDVKAVEMQPVFSENVDVLKSRIQNVIQDFNDGKKKMTGFMLGRLKMIKADIDNLETKAKAWATLLDTDQVGILPLEKQQELNLAWSALCQEPGAEVFGQLTAEKEELLIELKSKCDDSRSLSAEDFMDIYEKNQKIAQLGYGDALISVLGSDCDSVSQDYKDKKIVFDLALAEAAIACHKSLMVHAGAFSYYQKLKENIAKVGPDCSRVLTNSDKEVWDEFDRAITDLWQTGENGNYRDSYTVLPNFLYKQCKKIGGFHQRIARVSTKLKYSGTGIGKIFAFFINLFAGFFNSNKKNESVFSLKANEKRLPNVSNNAEFKKQGYAADFFGLNHQRSKVRAGNVNVVEIEKKAVQAKIALIVAGADLLADPLQSKRAVLAQLNSAKDSFTAQNYSNAALAVIDTKISDTTTDVNQLRQEQQDQQRLRGRGVPSVMQAGGGPGVFDHRYPSSSVATAATVLAELLPQPPIAVF